MTGGGSSGADGSSVGGGVEDRDGFEDGRGCSDNDVLGGYGGEECRSCCR